MAYLWPESSFLELTLKGIIDNYTRNKHMQGIAFDILKKPFVEGDLDEEQLQRIIGKKLFHLISLFRKSKDNDYALELFHGPSYVR